jgi:hypothetical protein
LISKNSICTPPKQTQAIELAGVMPNSIRDSETRIEKLCSISFIHSEINAGSSSV